MRIWSLHPKHLDTKGLVALWRETLLAQHVLNGTTKGYTNHPQLLRFKSLENPLEGINCYLAAVQIEATKRGYKFDPSKIDWNFSEVKMKVNSGQIEYELEHLTRKLSVRDPFKLEELNRVTLDVHPIFSVVDGPIESWEILSK